MREREREGKKEIDGGRRIERQTGKRIGVGGSPPRDVRQTMSLKNPRSMLEQVMERSAVKAKDRKVVD